MNAELDKAFDIVVLISGNGTNLQALIDCFASTESKITIKAVISNKAEAYGLQRAQNANIPTEALSHKDFSSRDAYDEALMQTIDRYSPKLIVLAGFMRILGNVFVSHYADRLINIHPSLLPKYRGLETHQRAIDAGDNQHGATVHYVNNELDAGPLVLQAIVGIESDDTAEILAKRVQEKEHMIYPLAVQWIAEQRIQLKQGTVYFDGKPITQAIAYETIKD